MYTKSICEVIDMACMPKGAVKKGKKKGGKKCGGKKKPC